MYAMRMTFLRSKVAYTKDKVEVSIDRDYLLVLLFHPNTKFPSLYLFGLLKKNLRVLGICERWEETLHLLLWLWSLFAASWFAWKLRQTWAWSNGRRRSRKIEEKRFIWLWLTARETLPSRQDFSGVCVTGMTTHRKLAILCLVNILILSIHLRDSVG